MRKLAPVFVAFGRKDLSILGTSKEHPKIPVRNALIYRIRAVIHNAHVVFRQQKEVVTYLADNFPSSMACGNDWCLHRARALFYGFDNVIFNVVSALDYLACTIGLFYVGKHRLKWNQLVNTARDNQHPFYRMRVAQLVLDWHSQWIDRMMGYRSGLIHFAPDPARFGTSVHSEGGQTTVGFHVDVPDTLRKALPAVVDAANPYLPQTTFLIVDRLLSCVDQVFDCVNAEILPKWEEVQRRLVEKARADAREGRDEATPDGQ